MRRYSLVCCAVALSGCYATTEVGYVNTVRAQGNGGVSVVARTGLTDIPTNEPMVALDVALRVDAATSGTRVALGDGILLAPALRHNLLTPFVRPSLWLGLGHWGRATEDWWLTPSLDVGVMTAGESGPNGLSLYLLGARLEYLGRGDEPERSLGGTVYIGYGGYAGFPHSCSAPTSRRAF